MSESEQTLCPRCQAVIPPGARFCPRCGLELPASEPSQSPGSAGHFRQTNVINASHGGAVATSNGNRVINTRTYIENQVNYGYLRETPEARKCPVCGKKIEDSQARFCPHCGAKLKGKFA